MLSRCACCVSLHVRFWDSYCQRCYVLASGIVHMRCFEIFCRIVVVCDCYYKHILLDATVLRTVVKWNCFKRTSRACCHVVRNCQLVTNVSCEASHCVSCDGAGTRGHETCMAGVYFSKSMFSMQQSGRGLDVVAMASRPFTSLSCQLKSPTGNDCCIWNV